jgi:ADP-ribose pyrophosphatase YjhB (NUDIX family)
VPVRGLPGDARRILIYGVTGSGKTTLAARLAGATGIGWHCVDDLSWEPGWVAVPDVLAVGRRRDAGHGHLLEIGFSSAGQDWTVTWCRPEPVPDGQPHGANAFCVTRDGGIVLISPDGERWGWPGGRPEEGESWEETLRREVLEETCTHVLDARLLGFTRGVCLRGHERGLVLVRGIWRAEVDLLAWEPRFEIPHRRVVPASELGDHLWIEPGQEPIYRRAIVEAGLA